MCAEYKMFADHHLQLDQTLKHKKQRIGSSVLLICLKKTAFAITCDESTGAATMNSINPIHFPLPNAQLNATRGSRRKRKEEEKMVVGSVSHEIESPVEAKRLWNALVKDGHNLLPKQVPELFSSITFVQGEGGVGSIKQINFTPANKDFSYVKEQVEEVDEEKLVYRYSHVEGGLLGKKVASAKYEFKYTPKAEGGCVCSSVVHFDSLPGVPHDEEKVKEIREMGTALFKKIEAYLLANPNL